MVKHSKKKSHIKAIQQITDIVEIIEGKLKVHLRKEKETKISEVISIVESNEDKK